jgi:hypothetical protein
MVTAHGSCARWRGGALSSDAMAAGRWQGVAGEHQWGPGVALDKMAEGGAHPRGGSTVGCDRGGSTAMSKVVEALRGLVAVARGDL